MHKRLYSLFEKQDGKWIRISESAFHKELAVKVYQNRLLAPLLGYETCKGVRELRPVKQGYVRD